MTLPPTIPVTAEEARRLDAAFWADLAELRQEPAVPVDPTLGAGYRCKDTGTGHEVYSTAHRTHVPFDVERGMDPGLFA